MRCCPGCSSERFNRSRLRLPDLPAALVLFLPVRCYDCYHRYFLPLTALLRSQRAPQKPTASGRATTDA